MSGILSRRACAVALATLCCAGRPASAQEPAAAPVRELLADPEALTRWIATHSHDALAEAARVAQAQAAYGASRLRPNPQVSASLGGIPAGATNPPGLGWGDTVNYGASVSQLFEVGKRQPRSAAARLRVTAEQRTFSSTLLGAIGDAREAMARVLYAKTRRAALTDSLDLSHQVLELQRVRFDRGDLSGVDFDRLQLDAQMLESDVTQATADLEDALATCAGVLGAPCDASNGDLSTVEGLLAPTTGTLPPGWDAHLAERPDLQALDAAQQAAAQDAVLAAKRRVPDPVVSLGFTRDRFVISGNNPKTLALGVTIPLPVFDRGQQDAARALAAQRELRETAAAVTTRARSDAEGLQRRQVALGTALQTLEQGALTRADSILTTTADAVNQGELSTTDLLLARRGRTDVTLKVMDLQLQLFLVQNELRQLQGIDAPAVERIQGATWPTP